jgi:hypothetical protein
MWPESKKLRCAPVPDVPQQPPGAVCLTPTLTHQCHLVKVGEHIGRPRVWCRGQGPTALSAGVVVGRVCVGAVQDLVELLIQLQCRIAAQSTRAQPDLWSKPGTSSDSDVFQDMMQAKHQLLVLCMHCCHNVQQHLLSS